MSPKQTEDKYTYRADSRLAPSQWETSLQSNVVFHWMGANLESALTYMNKSLMNIETRPTEWMTCFRQKHYMKILLHDQTFKFSLIVRIVVCEWAWQLAVTAEAVNLVPCHWPALCAGLLCCNFFDMLTPVPYHHFFSSLILLFIYV